MCRHRQPDVPHRVMRARVDSTQNSRANTSGSPPTSPCACPTTGKNPLHDTMVARGQLIERGSHALTRGSHAVVTSINPQESGVTHNLPRSQLYSRCAFAGASRASVSDTHHPPTNLAGQKPRHKIHLGCVGLTLQPSWYVVALTGRLLGIRCFVPSTTTTTPPYRPTESQDGWKLYIANVLWRVWCVRSNGGRGRQDP